MTIFVNFFDGSGLVTQGAKHACDPVFGGVHCVNSDGSEVIGMYSMSR